MHDQNIYIVFVPRFIMAQMAICKICGIEFKDSHPAKKINKFCCREHWLKHLREKGSWNKGKKWDEMYNKDTLDKLKTRITATGEDHHMYGVRRSDLLLNNLINNPMYSKEKQEEITKSLKEDFEGTVRKLMKNMTHDKRIAYQRLSHAVYGRKCIKCGTTEGQIDVHHGDFNRKNNNIKNTKPYCASCHAILHWKQRKEKEVNKNDNIK